METERLIFLGTSSCRFNLGNDTASYLLGNRILIDTGWGCVQNLMAAGVEPGDVSFLLFTHLHHDHYLSLPSFLFHWLCLNKPLSELTIAGPAGDLAGVVENALNFLQVKRFYPGQSCPTMLPLKADEEFKVGLYTIRSGRALHPVDALCYRIANPSGVILGFSGDTGYSPSLGEFFAGCDALIHECSLGPDFDAQLLDNRMLHSSARNAGRVAREANAGQLILTHGDTSLRSQCVDAAHLEYGGPVSWPERGETYNFLNTGVRRSTTEKEDVS